MERYVATLQAAAPSLREVSEASPFPLARGGEAAGAPVGLAEGWGWGGRLRGGGWGGGWGYPCPAALHGREGVFSRVFLEAGAREKGFPHGKRRGSFLRPVSPGFAVGGARRELQSRSGLWAPGS